MIGIFDHFNSKILPFVLVLFVLIVGKFVFVTVASPASPETLKQFQESMVSKKLFLHDIVRGVCYPLSRWNESIDESKRFVAPFIPANFVNESVDIVLTYNYCIDFIAQRYYSQKLGDFYELTIYLNKEIDRRLEEFGFENWLPLKYHIEGNIMGFPEKLSILQSYANDERVETICEIGFNTGYSTLYMALQNPKAKFILFDVFYHNYSALALSTIQEIFPNRDFIGIAGESYISVPRFHRMFPDIQCNLIFIDGGHSTEAIRSDIENMMLLANHSFHRLLVDDTKEGNHIYNEYQHFVSITRDEDETRSMYSDLNDKDSYPTANGPKDHEVEDDDNVYRQARLRHIHQYFPKVVSSASYFWQFMVYPPGYEDLNYMIITNKPCEAYCETPIRPYVDNGPSGLSVAEYLF